MKKNVFNLISFVDLDKINKIKICHMVASKHPDVIEVRQWFIATYVFDSEEAAGGGYIDDYVTASYEEY